MPLSLDYRPKNLDEIVGNQAVVESLKSIFSRQSDFPHAMLFQGPPGCGKTTLARIVKDMLKCNGSDFVEINAANNRGIDTARQVVDGMKYRPMIKDSRCRTYLLDEAHQWTGDASNALLKALEEPPDHVYFLLCTTDPGKLLPTIRNRCMTFEVQALNERQLQSLLKWVLNGEEFRDFPLDIIRQIAEVVDGCPRQALVILDQIIDMPVEKMSSVIQDIQTGDRNTADLCKALLGKQSWSRLVSILKQMDLSNQETIRRAVVGWMSAEVMKGDSPQAAMVYEDFKEPFYNTGKAGLIMACYRVCVMSDGKDDNNESTPF